jgi:hypothetical protein
LNSQIKFRVQGKDPIIKQGSAVSIDYLNIGNPKIHISSNNNEKKIEIPKDYYLRIKISFDKEEILGLEKSSAANYVVIGQGYGSSLKLEEEDKAFKIIRVYNAEKADWEEVWQGFDKIHKIQGEIEQIVNKTSRTITTQRKSTPTAKSKAAEEEKKNKNKKSTPTAKSKAAEEEKKNKNKKSTTTFSAESEDRDRITQEAKPQEVQEQGPKTEKVLQQ